MMMKIKRRCFSSFLRFIFKKDIHKIELHFLRKDNTSLQVSLWKFKLIYNLSNKLCNENVWLVFLIDNKAKVFCSLELNILLDIKSYRWVTSKRLSFLPNTTKYLPEGNNEKTTYISFLKSEIKDHKLMFAFFLFIGGCIFFLNNSISLLGMLISANLTIITLFISIFLVLFALNTDNRSQNEIDEFYSGVYNIKYHFNINTFHTAILSLSLSLISLIVINIDYSDIMQLIDFIQTTQILKISSILVTTCFYLTYICLLNIVSYYLKYARERFYTESISNIVSEQKINLAKKSDNIDV